MGGAEMNKTQQLMTGLPPRTVLQVVHCTKVPVREGAQDERNPVPTSLGKLQSQWAASAQREGLYQ